MAKVEHRVCDRCEKEINNYNGYFAKVRTIREFDFIIAGYSHKREMELCTDCAKTLNLFLYPHRNK